MPVICVQNSNTISHRLFVISHRFHPTAPLFFSRDNLDLDFLSNGLGNIASQPPSLKVSMLERELHWRKGGTIIANYVM